MPQDPRMIRSSPCLVLSQEISITGSQIQFYKTKTITLQPGRKEND